MKELIVQNIQSRKICGRLNVGRHGALSNHDITTIRSLRSITKNEIPKFVTDVRTDEGDEIRQAHKYNSAGTIRATKSLDA